MFRVQNPDFIAEKLASELLPDQEFREVVQNALEAVRRRMQADGSSEGGRVELDVDWNLLAASGDWYLACADNGDGMNRSEIELYTTTLAVVGAGNSQSITGNQGMGLKVSGPTRHKKGVVLRSLKDGERSMVQIGWNEDERGYGLLPIGEEGRLTVTPAKDLFPPFVLEQGSGTVVSFLGSVDHDNTFVPPGRPRGWLFRYLNARYFRLSHDGIQVRVRVPSGDQDEWPRTPEEARDRVNKKGGSSFNPSVVYGTATVWDDAADRLGIGRRDVMHLSGDPLAAVPPADLHWWVLPTGPGTDVSSRTFGGGALAILYQGELHDWRSSSQANPFFARLGILFGKNRVAFVLEPKGPKVSSDFARAHVLVDGTPVFESDAWDVWAKQFRTNIPDVIKATMAEEQSRLEVEDPDRIRRIRDRLTEVLQLLKPRRFRPTTAGTMRASGSEVAGAGAGDGEVAERKVGTGHRRNSGGMRGLASLLPQADDGGAEADEVYSEFKLDPRWVSPEEADDFTLVNSNGAGLKDRAAALAGADARTAPILLLNREFRGFLSLVEAVSEWANPEGDDDKGKLIESATREWTEQKMIEAVYGVRQLDNGRTWITQNFDDALSPVALTAAFMADRYHTLREVKRAVGGLRAVGAA
ncbi:MAG TPA: hypothetical protein VKR24_09615 [Candidatus Limnocylindrales bacterium]|nr:hypothetical protein [Candidatus Limnocylindrales bacterium]